MGMAILVLVAEDENWQHAVRFQHKDSGYAQTRRNSQKLVVSLSLSNQELCLFKTTLPKLSLQYSEDVQINSFDFSHIKPAHSLA